MIQNKLRQQKINEAETLSSIFGVFETTTVDYSSSQEDYIKYLLFGCSARKSNALTLDMFLDTNYESEEKSYIIGFLLGNIFKTGDFTLALTYEDTSFIRSFVNYGINYDVSYVSKDFIYITPEIKIPNFLDMLSRTTTLPNLKYCKAFILGLVDTGQFSIKSSITPRVVLEHLPPHLINFIQGVCEVKFSRNNSLKGTVVLDFLGDLYKDAKYFLPRHKKIFQAWSTKLGIKNTPVMRVVKHHEDAVIPAKVRVSDTGYDLTLISIKKQSGKITWYDTGISVKPEFGWYFDVVPRSSLSKTGYMLANSVGIIDRAYTGSILVPLIKVDDSMPNIELPFRAVQLIPRQIVHFEVTQVASLDETSRGDKGFGSSG